MGKLVRSHYVDEDEVSICVQAKVFHHDGRFLVLYNSPFVLQELRDIPGQLPSVLSDI